MAKRKAKAAALVVALGVGAGGLVASAMPPDPLPYAISIGNVAGDSSRDACHPSYPTRCIPHAPPDLDCADVRVGKPFEVLPPDPHGFDGDNDGWGCE